MAVNVLRVQGTGSNVTLTAEDYTMHNFRGEDLKTYTRQMIIQV